MTRWYAADRPGDLRPGAPTGGRSYQASPGDTSRQARAWLGGWVAVAWLAGACSQAEPSPPAARDPGGDVTGTLTVGGAPAQLVRCRPGHGVQVFVEVDTSLGTLRFGDAKLAWRGAELACAKLDRSWGGGVRLDGSAYFRGSLAFRCGTLTGDLALDCGHITPQEAAELARNRAAAKAQGTPGNPPNP